MQIVAIIRRWIEVLAALLLAWRARRREGRSLIIRDEAGQLVIRTGAPGRDAIIRDAGSQEEPSGLALSAGVKLPSDMARAARDGFVILELPADRIVTRRTNVPAQAREFLLESSATSSNDCLRGRPSKRSMGSAPRSAETMPRSSTSAS